MRLVTLETRILKRGCILVPTARTKPHTKMENNTENKIRSGVTGVVWRSKPSKWEAQIKAYGKMLYLGRFKNLDDAVKARRDAELEYRRPTVTV